MHVALSSRRSEEKVPPPFPCLPRLGGATARAADAPSAPQCLWEAALWLGSYPILPCTQVGSPGTERVTYPIVSADGRIGTSDHVVKLAGREHSRAQPATSTTRGFPGNCLGMIVFTEAC